MARTVKLLGIHIDDSLTWQAHSNHICNKLRSALYGMNRLKNTLNLSALISMYYGLFHSHLLYGILLWGSASSRYLQQIYKLQKRAVHCLAQKAHNTLPTTDDFEQFSIPRLSHLFNIECVKYAFRFNNNILPSPNTTHLTHFNHHYNTRARDTFAFRVQRVNRAVYGASFIHRSQNIWNALPAVVRNHTRWPPLATWLKSNPP